LSPELDRPSLLLLLLYLFVLLAVARRSDPARVESKQSDGGLSCGGQSWCTDADALKQLAHTCSLRNQGKKGSTPSPIPPIPSASDSNSQTLALYTAEAALRGGRAPPDEYKARLRDLTLMYEQKPNRGTANVTS